jgi:6-pyruvoyltetrahydropterin/6-carboxytetrahydropterin synthase
MIRLTRQYRFSASHRLHTPALDEQTNRTVFGKCNNPHGHGHNYVLEVTARGPLDSETGRCVNVERLDQLVAAKVLREMHLADLNRLPDFSEVVPTTENLAQAVRNRLSRAWSDTFPGVWPVLDKVRILETRRNFFEVAG